MSSSASPSASCLKLASECADFLKATTRKRKDEGKGEEEGGEKGSVDIPSTVITFERELNERWRPCEWSTDGKIKLLDSMLMETGSSDVPQEVVTLVIRSVLIGGDDDPALTRLVSNIVQTLLVEASMSGEIDPIRVSVTEMCTWMASDGRPCFSYETSNRLSESMRRHHHLSDEEKRCLEDDAAHFFKRLLQESAQDVESIVARMARKRGSSKRHKNMREVEDERRNAHENMRRSPPGESVMGDITRRAFERVVHE